LSKIIIIRTVSKTLNKHKHEYYVAGEKELLVADEKSSGAWS
jgi:hypothetical protein